MRKFSDLHNYQLTGVDHIMDTQNAGLFLDMGLGKTVTTLTALDKLIFEEFDVNRALVIAPKRVVESVWAEEAKEWEHLNGLTFSRIIGNEKQRRAALAQRADIYLISRDNIAWLCGLYGGSFLPFDMLVIDESSSFKNPKSLRFKALRAVLASFKRVVILTGTPAPNGLIDLWSQVYLLDKGQRLGKFLATFREEFFKPNKQNAGIVYNYKLQSDECESAIHERIADICISMKAKDYLELPKRINNYIKIQFPPELQKRYDEFEEEQVLEIIEGEGLTDANCISAMSAAALANKLLQFANGAVYDKEKIFHEVHQLKLEETLEIIEQSQGKPVLIAWTYKSDRDRLMAYLKKYKPKELKNNNDIEEWNKKKLQVLMMHPASGGHGLNLQAGGNTIIWFGQTWSSELYQQFNARLDRQGQIEAVIAHHLVAMKTIDMDVIKALDRKIKTQDGLMAAIQARVKNYMR